MGAAVITHGDPAPVFDAPEHVFDFVALLVERFIIRELYPAVFSWRDAGRYSSFDKRLPEPVCVIAAICKKLFCFWKVIQKACSAFVIAHLSFGQKKNDRLALTIANGVQL